MTPGVSAGLTIRLQDHLTHFLPRPRASHVSKKSWSPWVRNCFRAASWVLGALTVTGLTVTRGLVSEQSYKSTRLQTDQLPRGAVRNLRLPAPGWITH